MALPSNNLGARARVRASRLRNALRCRRASAISTAAADDAQLTGSIRLGSIAVNGLIGPSVAHTLQASRQPHYWKRNTCQVLGTGVAKYCTSDAQVLHPRRMPRIPLRYTLRMSPRCAAHAETLRHAAHAETLRRAAPRMPPRCAAPRRACRNATLRMPPRCACRHAALRHAAAGGRLRATVRPRVDC
jgi:hypothetical protein